jgi:hypothetical protein
MEIRFKYDDLINRCEQLSSFETEGKVDAAGQSRYLEIHINEVDKLLIQQYITQARGVLEERMERMIASVTENAGISDEATEEAVEIPGFTWTLRTDTRWKQNNSLAKHISEAIVSYTMSAWLSDRLPERVAFYDALFTASTEMAVKNIFKKQVPRYEE